MTNPFLKLQAELSAEVQDLLGQLWQADDGLYWCEAAAELAKRAEPDTVPALLALLEHGDHYPRRAASSALSPWLKGRQVDEVVAIIERHEKQLEADTVGHVVIDAVHLLWDIRSRAVTALPKLCQLLGHPNKYVRYNALRAIADVDEKRMERSKTEIIRMLSDPDSLVHGMACLVVSRWELRQAVPELVAQLRRSPSQFSIWPLGQFGHPAAVDALFEVLENEEHSDYWRRDAAIALASIGTPQALKAVREWLPSLDAEVRGSVEEALKKRSV